MDGRGCEEGAARGDGLSERRTRLLRRGLQGLALLYVFGYAALYKQTHLQVERLIGSVDVQVWPGEKMAGADIFAQLPYCQASQVRCDFVNEIDVLSMGEAEVFIPTHVVVNHQRSSCASGSPNDTAGCRLGYSTGPESMVQVDEYFIGNVEKFQLTLGHAFHSEVFGEGVLADAKEIGVPRCPEEGQPFPPMCRETAPGDWAAGRGAGGHDRTSVGGLLELAGTTLDSNNDETDHPGGREPFRESGVKLRIDVHYTNLGSWLGSWESLGYSYKVRIIPAASVWDGLTISSLREARAWLSPDKLKDFGQYDRVLVFADGIQVSAKLHGKLGALDMTQLLLTVVSALLLLFFAELIAEMLAACLLGEGRPAGANQRLAAGEQPGASSCTAAAVAEDEEEAGEHLLRRAEHPPGSGGGDGR